MNIRINPNVEAATQYLIWALEELEKAAHPKAAHHARVALDALRGGTPPIKRQD